MAYIMDTDISKQLDTYLIVAVLSYSSYIYTKDFMSRKLGGWIVAHVNVYRYLGSMTWIPDTR